MGSEGRRALRNSSSSGRAHDILHPPLWARWLLTVLAFAALLVILLVVNSSAGGGGGGSAKSERSAEVEANRESQIVIAEDEAPHSARLGLGDQPRRALVRAVTADAAGRIRHGELTGPLQGVHCVAAGHSRAGRSPYSCTVRAAEVEYPFVAVVDRRSRWLTWCKVDPPPTNSSQLEVPVSSRCRV